MPYTIQSITMEDIPGLAQTMMSAFHQDPHWALVWPNMTLEEIIDGCAHRLPRNLIIGREKKRHQIVVETGSDEVVGYARWLLPPHIQDGEQDDKLGFWSEAQILEPAAEQREAYEAEWKSVTVDGSAIGLNQDMVATLSPKLEEEDERIKNGEEFLGKLVLAGYIWNQAKLS